MAEEATVPGYEVGRELGWSTPQLFGAGLAYGTALLLTIPVAAFLASPMTGAFTTEMSVEKVTGLFVALGVSLTLGIWATIAHLRSPLSRATVVRTVRNCDGLYSAEMRFLDGSTIEHNLGLALPLGRQYAGFTKALFTGR